jgi:hypothetical protein
MFAIPMTEFQTLSLCLPGFAPEAISASDL